MNDFRAKVHAKLHPRFGVSARFVPTIGVSCDVTVKLNRAVDVYGEDFQVTGAEDQIVILLSDISNAKKGDFFIVNGVKYYLVRKIKDDSVRQIWSVTSVS